MLLLCGCRWWVGGSGLLVGAVCQGRAGDRRLLDSSLAERQRNLLLGGCWGRGLLDNGAHAGRCPLVLAQGLVCMKAKAVSG